MLVKPMTEEVSLATETDVNLASVVRVVNTGASTLITVKDGASTVASLTLTQGEVLHLQKAPTHKLVATASVKAVKVAHAN